MSKKDTDEYTQSFVDYWNAVDDEMESLFMITTYNAGIEPDAIAAAQEENMTPVAFAHWIGVKYDLVFYYNNRPYQGV
jgi:hypothetical protein